MFDGVYMNGEKIGKGKEYHNGELKFEGEYLNGKKWNGKIYEEGNTICELRDGKGILKQYISDNVLIYEAIY